jgi:hypothetical protein
MSAGRYRDRHAGAEFDRLLVLPAFAPDAPISRNDVPDFFDRVMATAFATAFGCNAKTARPPREPPQSTRTSDPSSAIASGALLIRLVSNCIVNLQAATEDGPSAISARDPAS